MHWRAIGLSLLLIGAAGSASAQATNGIEYEAVYWGGGSPGRAVSWQGGTWLGGEYSGGAFGGGSPGFGGISEFIGGDNRYEDAWVVRDYGTGERTAGQGDARIVWACVGAIVAVLVMFWHEFREQWKQALECGRADYSDKYWELEAAGERPGTMLKVRAALSFGTVGSFIALVSGGADIVRSIDARLGR